MPTPLVGTTGLSVTRIVNYSDEALVGAYLKHYRDYSSRTLRERDRQLGHLAVWLRQRDSNLAGATREQLDAFRDQIGGSSANVANYVSALRVFYSFLVRAGVRIDNPTELLRPPKLPAKKRRKAPDAEIAVVLRVAATRDAEIYAMLRLKRFCGFRCSDIARLRVEWLQDEDGLLVAELTGKGGRERSVPVDPETARVLRPFLTHGGPVFTRPSDGLGYREQAVSRKLNAFVHEVCGYRWNVHRIRARAATEIYNISKDPVQLCEMFGWSDWRTAKHYIDVDMSTVGEHVIEAARRFDTKYRRRA